jgi:hypothetical protein
VPLNEGHEQDCRQCDQNNKKIQTGWEGNVRRSLGQNPEEQQSADAPDKPTELP